MPLPHTILKAMLAPLLGVALLSADMAVAQTADLDASLRPVSRPVPEEALSIRPVPRPETLAARAEAVREAERRARLNAQNAASVANPRINSAATLDDALLLNTIGLIGVFGTEENRRALLRLETGEFVRVSIGATVDGWRVISIGTEEVRLLRSGQARLIRLPS